MNDNDMLLLIGQQRGKNVAPRRLLPRAAHQSQQGIQPPRILEVTTVTTCHNPNRNNWWAQWLSGSGNCWNLEPLGYFHSFSRHCLENLAVNSQSSSEPEKKKMKGRNLGLDPRWVPQML